MPKRHTADEMEEKLGVELPNRYRKFLDGEFDKLAEDTVEMKTHNGPLPVHFKREAFDGFTLDDTGLLPLATLGDDDPRLLMVDPKGPNLPVVERNELTGEFNTVESSLEDFLKSLRTEKGKAKKSKRK